VIVEDRVAMVFAEAARGVFPPADGAIEVVPSPRPVKAAVFGFTAHLVVAADGVTDSHIDTHLGGRDFSEWMGPGFLSWLEAHTGGHAGSHDAVLAAFGTDVRKGELLVTVTRPDHPRVQRSGRYRADQIVYALEAAPDAGVVILGHGVAGRLEIAVEVDEAARGGAIGRRIIAAALGLAPKDTPVFAQVAPGNVASMRCFLAAGFTPVASEILLTGT
jgi:hypothetical protein